MPPAVLLLFAVLFPLGWCFTLFMSSWGGGWAALASKYRAVDESTGRRFLFQSATLGRVNYGMCLTIVLGRDGLYLKVFPIFRFWHPPLLIPWSEFSEVREKRVLGLWRMVEMRVGTPPIATLLLPLNVIEQRPRDQE